MPGHPALVVGEGAHRRLGRDVGAVLVGELGVGACTPVKGYVLVRPNAAFEDCARDGMLSVSTGRLRRPPRRCGAAGRSGCRRSAGRPSRRRSAAPSRWPRRGWCCRTPCRGTRRAHRGRCTRSSRPSTRRRWYIGVVGVLQALVEAVEVAPLDQVVLGVGRGAGVDAPAGTGASPANVSTSRSSRCRRPRRRRTRRWRHRWSGRSRRRTSRAPGRRRRWRRRRRTWTVLPAYGDRSTYWCFHPSEEPVRPYFLPP